MLDFTKLRGTALIHAITAASGSCFILFGYDNGVMAGLITAPSFTSAMGNPSSGTTGTIVAVYNLGCFVGCMLAAAFGFKLGRRRTLLLGNVVLIIGTVIQTASYGVPQLIVGRIVTGMGTGLNTATIPTWVSETAKAEARGSLIATQLAIVSAGIVIAYWLDYAMVRGASGQVVWRFPIAFQAFFALLTICMVLFLPESPRWLYAVGRTEEADHVMARLLDEPADGVILQRERNGILEAIKLERQQPKFTIRDMFRNKNSDLKITRRIILGFVVQCIQQFTGISVVVNYLPYLIENQLFLSGNLALIIGGIAAVVYLIASIPPIFYVDRLGRRKMLMFGSVAMSLAWLLFIIFVTRSSRTCLYIAIVMIFLYQIAFAFSWLSVPWIYPSEITPLNVRHIGSGFATSAEWLTAFLIAEVSPVAIDTISWRFYLVFLCVCIISIPVVYFFFPETAGKTLEEIDVIFASGALTEGKTERIMKVQKDVETGSHGEDEKDEHVENLSRANSGSSDQTLRNP
ncbi:hypothetical protein YB2330_001681 [Saitoella coloradoensis]